MEMSDDDRSVAADSWSVKSEYGSVLDADELIRQAEALEALAIAPPSQLSNEQNHNREEDCNADSLLGLQSYWNNTYAEELANFQSHGDSGEIWFGESVMETVAEWTASLCASIAAGAPLDTNDSAVRNTLEHKSWKVLDVGTGNGVFLHALWKQGFTDLTGTDYSEGAIELAKAVAQHKGIDSIKFVVDDLLETKLEGQFKLVTDKGTLDAIGLHPDGASRRLLYWKTVSKLLVSGGLLVLTSCNHTKEELVNEAASSLASDDECGKLEYVDHVRTYPTFRFNGVEGSRVSTVAFILRPST